MWLYVPGDAAAKTPNALSSDADCVIVDLKDAALTALTAQARSVALTSSQTPRRSRAQRKPSETAVEQPPWPTESSSMPPSCDKRDG